MGTIKALMAATAVAGGLFAAIAIAAPVAFGQGLGRSVAPPVGTGLTWPVQAAPALDRTPRQPRSALQHTPAHGGVHHHGIKKQNQPLHGGVGAPVTHPRTTTATGSHQGAGPQRVGSQGTAPQGTAPQGVGALGGTPGKMQGR